ncbi:hypothetical protein F4777DRAFT_321626 [Nemania sp. FL0916]|nr:hypothetical protein F4777DRAFT_321626 [Nemania sp. FL0916]
MAESHHAEGVITVDSREEKGPTHHNANQTAGEITKHEGPAPPTSLPPALIQEEYVAPAAAPIADNIPQVVEVPNPPDVTPLQHLTEEPTYIDCPFCNRRALTRITKEGDSQQSLASLVCCLICLCFACLPQLAGWCENVHVWCTACGRKVAMIPHNGGPVQLAPRA